MNWFKVLAVILLCLACSDDTIIVQLEEMPESSIPLIRSGAIINCYQLGRNEMSFFFDSPSAPNQILINPSQDWINNYFKAKIENKRFYYGISFPNDTVAIRLYLPSEDSTLIRQAFISESEILKPIGSSSYSSGHMYPPQKELHISWDFTDSLGIPVTPGWYAFSTEFVEEGRAVIFWFKLVE